MSDVLFLLLILGSFAVLVAFVGWCERIVDSGTPRPHPVTDDRSRR